MSRLDSRTTLSRSNDRPVMRPRGEKLHPFIKNRLAIGTAALAALLSSCNDSGEYTGPMLVQNTGSDTSGGEIGGVDGRAIGDPQDVTGTSDDAADVAIEVTPDDASGTVDMDEVERAKDIGNGTDDGVNDAAGDVVVEPPKDGTVVDAAMADMAAETADTKPAEVKASETVQPKTPKEICEANKAAAIAALKPGEPECTQVIPQVGKKPGVLVCSGSNQDPNCVVK